ncbi:MAG: hypothetical protein SH809_11010 [Rhodothermales bacterium]|nr:hypothetical protein [Rhodothermales bacterium]
MDVLIDLSTPILTAVLVGITGYYAWVTRKMMKVSEESLALLREQHGAAVRPYVSVRVELGSEAIYYLVIENVGRSTATNLKLSIDRQFEIIAAPPNDISDMHLFSEGVSFLVPGDRITYGLVAGHGIFGPSRDVTRWPLQFVITAVYSHGMMTYEEKTEIDLNRYEGIIQYFGPIPSAIHKLTAELKGVRSLLNKKLS